MASTRKPRPLDDYYGARLRIDWMQDGRHLCSEGVLREIKPIGDKYYWLLQINSHEADAIPAGSFTKVRFMEEAKL